MNYFESEYFKKESFTPEMIRRYAESAQRDLQIAQKDKFLEVRFSYAYQALLKTGMAIIAFKGGVRIRSIPGHHVKILTHLSRLLDDQDVLATGNAMRMKRNKDLYNGGEYMAEKEVEDYVKFVGSVVHRVQKLMGAKEPR